MAFSRFFGFIPLFTPDARGKFYLCHRKYCKIIQGELWNMLNV